MRRIRDEDEFDHLYSQSEHAATELDLSQQVESRRNARPPERYETQQKTSSPHLFTNKEKLRTEYFKALDLLTAEIERRFDQPGLSQMVMLDNLLHNDTDAPREEDIQAVTEIYDDIEQDKLIRELRSLLDLFSAQGNTPSCPTTVYEWAKYFATQPATVRHLFRETIKITQLLLVVPATAAGAERSFSSLRRLKTWLRRTMTQKGLTHLAVLHCHRERAGECDISALVKDFACKTAERRITFGF